MAPTTTDALRELFSENQGRVSIALDWITSLTRESATNRRLFTSDERVIPHILTLFRAGNGNQLAVCVLTELAKASAAVQSQIAEFDEGFLIPALAKELTADSTQKANQANLVAALEALVSLADRHDANQARIINAGGITRTVALLQKQVYAMGERMIIITYGHRNVRAPELTTPVVAGATKLLRALACGTTASGRAAVVTGSVIGVLVNIFVGPFNNEVDRDKYKELRSIWREWIRLVEPVLEELTHQGDASTAVLTASQSSIPKLVQEASSSYLSPLVWLGLLAKTSTEMQNAIVRNGGVATLYERLVSGQEDCVRLSAWALSNVADKNDSVQLTVIEHGGIATLLPLLGASMDYRFSTIARLLGSLGEANSERHAEAIARAGGLPFLVAHLRYGTHDRVQQWTIPVLRRVLFTGQDKHDNVAQTMFRKRGGLAVLDELCSSPSIKANAIELLRDLAASDRVELAKPEVVLKEVDHHESTEWRLPPIDYVDAYAYDLQSTQYYDTKQVFAARGLANLACSNPANRVLVAHTGVIVVLVQWLRSWSEKVHGYLGNQETAAMAAVAKVIRNLASDAVNRDAFELLNVVPPLVAILKSDKSLKLKAAAASALGSLASHGHTANQQAIAKHEGIPALVELLREATKPKPQETAVKTLWVLAKDSSVHRTAIVDAGGVSAVDECIKTCLQLEAKEVIYWATRLQEIVKKHL